MTKASATDTTAFPLSGTAPLVLTDVSKIYEDTVALQDVSFSIPAGELVVLLGPSGAGKSTIFRCVTGLTRPDSGSIEVAGAKINTLAGRALRDARRNIGLIFQQFNLIGRLSAIKNVLGGRLGHAPTWRVVLRLFERRDRQLALANLDSVGLLDKAYQRADSLSGGQQQRVAIARVLTQESQIILADEPVSSLDPESSETVLTILKAISRERGIAVLCSLHQVDLAKRYADRIIGLRAGRIVYDGLASGLTDQALDLIYRRNGTDAELIEPASVSPLERASWRQGRRPPPRGRDAAGRAG